MSAVRYHTIHDPVYGLTCYMFRGTAQAVVKAFAKLPNKRLRAWAREEISEDYLSRVCGTACHHYIDGRVAIIVVISGKESVFEQQDTLLHEVLHIVDSVFAAKGVWKKGVEAGEPLTYYVTWMFREGRKGLGL